MALIVVACIAGRIFPKIPVALLLSMRGALLIIGSSIAFGLPSCAWSGVFIGIERNGVDPSRRRAGGKWEKRSVFRGGFTALFSTAARGSELCRGSVGQRRMGL
jgi:hypothetical protein